MMAKNMQKVQNHFKWNILRLTVGYAVADIQLHVRQLMVWQTGNPAICHSFGVLGNHAVVRSQPLPPQLLGQWLCPWQSWH